MKYASYSLMVTNVAVLHRTLAIYQTQYEQLENEDFDALVMLVVLCRTRQLNTSIYQRVKGQTLSTPAESNI